MLSHQNAARLETSGPGVGQTDGRQRRGRWATVGRTRGTILAGQLVSDASEILFGFGIKVASSIRLEAISEGPDQQEPGDARWRIAAGDAAPA